MPPRHRSSSDPGLTLEDLSSLAEVIASGKRATVYLREATPGLDLPAGASARVVRIDGNTLTLRPRGVDDELPFESEEVRMTKQPPIARKAVRAPRKPATPAEVAVTAPAPVSNSVPMPDSAPESAPAPKSKPRPAKKPASGLSVVLAAGIADEWVLSVAYGSRQRGKPVPISADAVLRAVRELGEDAVIEAVESVVAAARTAAADRVEELSRQLAQAKTALAALGVPE